MATIRPASLDDLESITKIYNHAILKTTATFDTEPKTIENRRIWFDTHGERYPIFVVEENQSVLGWASLSKWDDRCAYHLTVEFTVYIDPSAHGRGYGTALLQRCIDAAKQLGYHTIVSRIAGENQASFRLHEKFGFEKVGVLKEVGTKFNRRLDVHYYQYIIH